VAITILDILTASFPPAIVFSTKAVYAQKEQTISENLSRNQIEFIKNTAYISGEDGPWDGDGYPLYTIVPVPDDSYEIRVAARPIHIVPETLDHEYLPQLQDEGIQEITVDIWHVDKVVLTTQAYKVRR
jgi:hypothetical protein